MTDHIPEELLAFYQDLHSHPELSSKEHRTMEKIAAQLTAWGIECTPGLAGTGVIATLKGNRPGRTIGIRADIDALPIPEETGLPYASENAGVMHACGHDVHTTILMGAAKALKDLDGDFPGTMRLIFQPAEESGTPMGAFAMIEQGCLEDPHVDHVIGLHVEPNLPTGTVGLRYGKFYAGADRVHLIVHGVSSHGARPHQGIDAIVVAAHIITAIQTIISRRTAPTESALISFGTIQGGNAGNQICDRVELTGIIRTLTPEAKENTFRRVKELAESVAAGMEASVEVLRFPAYPPLINDDTVVRASEDLFTEMLGAEHVYVEPVPEMCAEDFAYYAMERPSCFYHLGCLGEGQEQHPLHSCFFQPDLACIPVGIELQVALAKRLAEL